MIFIQKVGAIFLPAVLTAIAVLLLVTRKDLYNEFIKGAVEGLYTCKDLIPVLVLIITGTGMFSASGAMTALCGFISKYNGGGDFPSELIPLLIIRPLSGSGATATVNELFTQCGPDSFAGRCASVIMGASDTVVYTLSMYFGCVGVTKTRHAYPAAILTMLFCIISSYYITIIFFGK